jgi:hypothetical protein
MATPRQRQQADAEAQAILQRPAKDPLTQAQEVMDTICERIANGESLRAICKTKGIPTTTTVKRWLRENEAFRAQYVRAREDQADFYADEIITIADSAEDWSKARLQVDARKWVASKLLPKKYGDRVQLSGDESAPLVHKVILTGPE